MSDTKNKWHAIALVAGILLIAVNLRVPFTSIAPVLPLIQVLVLMRRVFSGVRSGAVAESCVTRQTAKLTA